MVMLFKPVHGIVHPIDRSGHDFGKMAVWTHVQEVRVRKPVG